MSIIIFFGVIGIICFLYACNKEFNSRINIDSTENHETKVYCKDCKNSWRPGYLFGLEILETTGYDFYCDITKEIINEDNAIRQHNKNIKYNCEELNKNNDCKYYKKGFSLNK